jgi:UDP-3-O-[3-hydroxymyristoyl] glucosamine N-acyltransferase
MKDIVIVGSGAVAAELTSYIEDNNKYVNQENQYNIKGYIDFDENIEKYWSRYSFKRPVIADIYKYEYKESDHFVVGISNLPFRYKMIEILQKNNAAIINFVHHSAVIADSAKMGCGNIIYPNCVIGPNAEIGNHNMIASYSCISHDCTIGNNNFFAAAILCGWVNVGDNNNFNVRSAVIPHINIGSGNTIQAGMIVDKNIENDTTIFYKYKEKIIAIPKQ